MNWSYHKELLAARKRIRAASSLFFICRYMKNILGMNAASRVENTNEKGNAEWAFAPFGEISAFTEIVVDGGIPSQLYPICWIGCSVKKRLIFMQQETFFAVIDSCLATETKAKKVSHLR